MAAVGVATVGALLVDTATWARRAPPSRPLVGIVLTLTVDTFRTARPTPLVWRPGPFTESLAVRLARVPGLGVTLGGGRGANADFTLDGEGALNNGRLVLTSRLYHRGESAAVWSTTFWRADAADSGLVRDLASDVAEALYGHLARHSSQGARP